MVKPPKPVSNDCIYCKYVCYWRGQHLLWHEDPGGDKDHWVVAVNNMGNQLNFWPMKSGYAKEALANEPTHPITVCYWAAKVKGFTK